MSIWRIPIRIESPSMPGPGFNIWHARVGGVIGDAGDEINTIAGWLNEFYSAVDGLMPSGGSINFDGEVQQLATTEPGVPSGVTTWTIGTAGAAEGLPAANTLVIGWQTSLANRKGRGRTFIGPLVRTISEANGTPEESQRAFLQTAVNVLVQHSLDQQNAGLALGVWSPTDGVLRDFVSGQVKNKFGVLRSRRD